MFRFAVGFDLVKLFLLLILFRYLAVLVLVPCSCHPLSAIATCSYYLALCVIAVPRCHPVSLQTRMLPPPVVMHVPKLPTGAQALLRQISSRLCNVNVTVIIQTIIIRHHYLFTRCKEANTP
ncbi:hypothetical protein GGI42DRAFT_37415 [Trichoderma sp. SZMC 28013]